MAARPLIVLLSAMVAMGACGDAFQNEGAGGGGASPSATISTGSGGESSNGPSSNASSASSGAGDTAPRCPVTRPEANNSCTDGSDGIICSYGADPRPRCREFFICSAGKWTAYGIDTTSHCETQPLCTDEPTHGGGCEQADVFCQHGDALCECQPPGAACGLGGAGGVSAGCWCCAQAELLAGAGACPLVAPNSGDLCVGDGRKCRYHDPCDKGGLYECKGGVWQWLTAVTPDCTLVCSL